MSVPVRSERTVVPGRWQTGPTWPRLLPVVARWATTGLAVLLVFVVAGAAGLALYASSHQGRVYEGVRVGGVPVGGLTEAEAVAAISTAFDRYAAAPLTLRSDDETFALAPKDAGVRLDAAGSVSTAMAVGRAGSIWDRSRDWGRGLLRGVDLPLAVTVDPARADAAFRAIAPKIVRAPVDARVAMDANGQPDVVPDAAGVAIDLRTTIAGLLERAATLGSAPLDIATTSQPAAVAADSLVPSVGGARAAVDAPLTVRAAEGVWHVPAADLKHVVSVDPASAALRVDRRPLEAMVAGLAAQIDRAPVDAGIEVGADGRLAVVPSVDRAAVDVEATVSAIEAALLTGGDDVPLVVERSEPLIVDEVAAAAVARGDAMLDGGMTIAWPGDDVRLGRDDLLRALTIRTNPGRVEPFAFGLDPAVIAELLAPIGRDYDRPVKEATFRLVGGKPKVVTQAAEGRSLDLAAGAEDVLAAFGSDQPRVALTSRTIEPRWTAADLRQIDLGNDVLAEAGTYYGDSSEARRVNLELASSLASGWLVPPGGVYSYAEHLGPVSEKQGFQTGLGIVEADGGGFTTAPMIGGGICQVSTTIFQAAFWAGMPIVERYQHPYYLRSYGEAIAGLPGLDAMVNIEPDWTLDLKFENATDDWLVVNLVPDGQNLWVRLVGTDPGWDIQVGEPVITEKVAANPKMNYEDSSELPRGTERVVEVAGDGFDVSIQRTVKEDGQIVDDYVVAASFAPSQNLTLRGTGE